MQDYYQRIRITYIGKNLQLTFKKWLKTCFFNYMKTNFWIVESKSFFNVPVLYRPKWQPNVTKKIVGTSLKNTLNRMQKFFPL